MISGETRKSNVSASFAPPDTIVEQTSWKKEVVLVNRTFGAAVVFQSSTII